MDIGLDRAEQMLEPVRRAFLANPGLPNLLLDTELGGVVQAAKAGWRRSVAESTLAGVPVPAHAAALACFDTFRPAELPQNPTQAQRDAFGAQTCVRRDRPWAVHSDWKVP